MQTAAALRTTHEKARTQAIQARIEVIFTLGDTERRRETRRDTGDREMEMERHHSILQVYLSCKLKALNTATTKARTAPKLLGPARRDQ